MKVNELKDETLILDWFDTINASDNTKRNYLTAMQFFTEWTDKTPEELINEAEGEIKSGILPRQRNIKTYFIKFRKSLQDHGSAPMTVKTHMSGIKSFYRSLILKSQHFQSQVQKLNREKRITKYLHWKTYERY